MSDKGTLRRLVAGVVVGCVLLAATIGAAVYGLSERAAAHRELDHAHSMLQARETRTAEAASALHRTRRALLKLAPMTNGPLSDAQQLTQLEDQMQAAAHDAVHAGEAGAVADYNSAISRSNGLLDQFNMLRPRLGDEIATITAGLRGVT